MPKNDKLSLDVWASDTASVQIDGRDVVNLTPALQEQGDVDERAFNRVLAFVGLVLDDAELTARLWAEATDVEAAEWAKYETS